MDSNEFAAWTQHTDRARHGWVRDEVTWHNRKELLMHRGEPEHGAYLRVAGCIVEVGSYWDAFPHIGDARFLITGRRVFKTESDAYTAVVNATGLNGLMAILTGYGSDKTTPRWQVGGRCSFAASPSHEGRRVYSGEIIKIEGRGAVVREDGYGAECAVGLTRLHTEGAYRINESGPIGITWLDRPAKVRR